MILQENKHMYMGYDFEPITTKDVNNKLFCTFTDLSGLDDLINAIGIVRNFFPNIELNIIGKGMYEKNLRELVEKNQLNNHVIFHGAVVNGYKKLYESD